ncbi:MAG: hypothetical protein PHP17_02340 [Candidatus Omnitrophica bacterium]|nr:hypothetical protein [Candidatus Omnitrophota bacterium]
MRRCLILVILAVLMVPFLAFSEEKTITGEVVDLSCYVTAGAKGMDHKECALACIKTGEPAGILEESTGKVYIVITEDHKTRPQDKILPYVAQTVEVKGNVSERGGLNVIDIKEIKEMKAPAKGKDMEMPTSGAGY